MRGCPSCGLRVEDGIDVCVRCGADLAAHGATRVSDGLAETAAVEGTLGGYAIEREVGRGGMGVVYRARDEALGRTVALKVIAPALAAERGFRARFRRESRLAAQVEHPNVVPVYRAGQDRGRLYIAMRFIDGADLASLLRERGRLDPGDAASLVAQVAAALDAAHALGLVHRDVKPGNVLLAGGVQRAFLTDFGLTIEADAGHPHTRSGQWVGTLAYVAPEQLRGGAVDARADVYALGGLLHHCLTGQVPYPVSNELDAISAHLIDPPPRPTAVDPRLPAGFDAVLARAMAKEPGARYPSAGDLGAAALAAARGASPPQSERSVATGAAAPAPPVRSRRRRHVRLSSRRRLAAAAAVVVAASAGVIVAIATSGDRPVPAPVRGTPAAAVALAGKAIALPVRPDRIVVAGGSVWALDENGVLARADPRTGRAITRPVVSFGARHARGLASDGGTVWTGDDARTLGGVDRLDAHDGHLVARVSLRGSRELAVADGTAWVLAGSRLVAIDTAANRVTGAPVSVGPGAADVAADGRRVWVATPGTDRLLRIDADRRRVTARIPTGDKPTVIAASAGDVWVANLGDETLTHVDAASAQPIGAPVALGKQLQDLAIAAGSLWVAAADGTVTRLDARTGAVAGSVAALAAPLSLAAAPHGVWVASASSQQLRRIVASGHRGH